MPLTFQLPQSHSGSPHSSEEHFTVLSGGLVVGIVRKTRNATADEYEWIIIRVQMPAECTHPVRATGLCGSRTGQSPIKRLLRRGSPPANSRAGGRGSPAPDVTAKPPAPRPPEPCDRGAV